MKKMVRYSFITFILLFGFFISNTYGEKINGFQDIEITKEIHELEERVTQLKQEVNGYDDMKILVNELSTDIKLLDAKQEHNLELMTQRINNVDMPNVRVSRVLNALMLVFTIGLGVLGVKSYLDYIKQVVNEMCINKVTKDIKNKVTDEVYEKLYEKMYKQYSDELGGISDRLKGIEKYKVALEVLQEMGDKVE